MRVSTSEAFAYNIERRFERAWPLPWLADHYLIELERM